MVKNSPIECNLTQLYKVNNINSPQTINKYGTIRSTFITGINEKMKYNNRQCVC